MTITYSGSFIRTLFRWKGSIWKSIWKQFIIFFIMYYIINFCYRWAMDDVNQRVFENVVRHFEKIIANIPLTFLLGFYVFWIAGRWWDQFNCISWPDKFMVTTSALITGTNESQVRLRRTISRYANLASALTLRGVSIPILKRFPTVESMVKSGLMTEKELEMYNAHDGSHGKAFVPIIWITNIITKLKTERKLTSPEAVRLIDQINDFRGGLAGILCYDWISVPLVYTQVVVIATYGYFAFCLIGRQCLVERPENPTYIDMKVPLFTMLQLIFYLGWLIVGEDLMCPWGEDDEDFEMNYIFDRNVHIGYMIADDLHGELPELSEAEFPRKVANTRASLRSKNYVFPGHLINYSDTLSEKQKEIIEHPEEHDAEEASLFKRISGRRGTKENESTRKLLSEQGAKLKFTNEQIAAENNNSIEMEPRETEERDEDDDGADWLD